MSDDSPDDRAWRTSAGGPGPDDQDVLTALAGRIDPVHPIGPLGLRARTRRPYVLVTVAVAALLGGAGAALVVTGSGQPVPARNAAAAGSASPAPSPPGAGDPGSGAARGHASGPAILHGQYVERTPRGGYQTIDVQTGMVTAVSRASVTVRSSDGFIRSYLVARSTVVTAGPGGIASVKVGDQASVQATMTGSSETAASITDLTVLQHHGSALDRRRGTAGVTGSAAAASG
jgi:hypothetical protein